MDIVLGLLAIVVGAAVCLSGLRLFFIILPIWAFVAGFFVGAGLMTALFGDSFLSTFLGIVVGLVFGVVFAAISYLFWYIGVLIAAGSAGAVVGAALMGAFGVDSTWVLFLVGLIFSAVFVVAAFIARLPVLLVAINTAIAGSATAIGGVLLLFDYVDRSEIDEGVVWAKINDNWFLWIVWLVAAAIGFGVQMRDFDAALLPDERWVQVKAAQTSAA